MSIILKNTEELIESINIYKSNNIEKIQTIFKCNDSEIILKYIYIDVCNDFFEVYEDITFNKGNETNCKNIISYINCFMHMDTFVEKMLDSYINADNKDINIRKKTYLEFLFKIISFLNQKSWDFTLDLRNDNSLEHSYFISNLIKEM